MDNYKQTSSSAYPSGLPPMSSPLDPEEFRRQGYMVIDFIADYYKEIETYPVCSQVQPGYLFNRLPTSAPLHPEPIQTVLDDVRTHIIPGLSHWQSPNHFAYFSNNASIAGILGETLAAGFNVVGFTWISSPAATELEMIIMDWLGKMLSLPKEFMFSGGGGGTLLGTTCEAMLCCLVATRDRALERIGREKADKLVVYASDQTHFSFEKSAKIAGIHPDNFRVIPTSRSDNFAMSPEALRSFIKADVDAGLFPLFLCATMGTTSTTAVDPIRPLCEVAREFDVWVHVDAAYAGSACICPEYRHFIDGIEGAASFSFNAHKWMLATLDCCCLWVKDPNALVRALSTSPEILKNKATESRSVVDYKDWGLTLSRRFRALKMWMVLRSYGVNNLRRYIRSQVQMAVHFESLLMAKNRHQGTFEVVVPRYFTNVCFRVSPKVINLKGITGNKRTSSTVDRKPDEELMVINKINEELLGSINSSGKVFMTHTLVGGVYVIRFAFGATLSQRRHVEFAWKVIQDHAYAILDRRRRLLTTCDPVENGFP